MRVIANPQSIGAKGGHYHLVQFDTSQTSLCGLGKIYADFYGKRVQVMFDVDEAADCQACQKALEMILRGQLRMLTTAGLLKLLGTVQAMKNGDIR
jgi:hypothetical protein